MSVKSRQRPAFEDAQLEVHLTSAIFFSVPLFMILLLPAEAVQVTWYMQERWRGAGAWTCHVSQFTLRRL